MKIAITGGTGFVGSHLIPFFLQSGHEVILISRSAAVSPKNHVTVVTWNKLEEDPSFFEGIDAIVNLAGESINQRWSQEAKKRILDSRLQSTMKIQELMQRLEVKPKVLIHASSLAIYGTSEIEVHDERSPKQVVDFLSGIIEKWEASADQIKGVRVVKIRVGVVLGKEGGAFPPMALPYKLGVGGKIGSGKQWISWIHIEDMVRLIDYCMQQDDIMGPVNATSPNPVTNDQFGRAMAKAFHRPHWFPLPAFVMRLMFGELSTLLLNGQKVLPHVLLEHGFSFSYPTIDKALETLSTNNRL
jgi:uncharacterized protein (TIGR01777 family)